MGLKFNINIQIALVATTVGAISVIGMYLYQRKKKLQIPTVWLPIGKVKHLYVYPLKSGRRVALKTAKCTEFGIETENLLRDRSFIVYKEGTKEYKTARHYPKMILIELTATDSNHLIMQAPGMETLQINTSNLTNQSDDHIAMWQDEKIFTIDCGDEAAQWLSKYILDSSSGLRLGYHDALSLHRRTVEEVFKPFTKFYPNLDSAALGLYSDLSSYMLMNQSSVDELAARIHDETITANNFRPNILVEGKDIEPYAEDKWDWIKIGDVILYNVKPCARCMLTTVNPETGVKSENQEPLKTLKTYRKVKDLLHLDFEENDPLMGIHMTLKQAGLINVGDTVFLGTN